MDLSVLDVLQVFGRAGRPGLETSGQGFICTTGDKLQHYLDAVTSQVRVSCMDLTRLRLTICTESHRVKVCVILSFGKTVAEIIFCSFIKGRIDAMNAEIALGTVATVGDGVRWLGYTYLFARMQKNPWLYGELNPQTTITTLIMA